MADQMDFESRFRAQESFILQIKTQFEELQKRYGEERKLRVSLETKLKSLQEEKQEELDASWTGDNSRKRKNKKAKKTEDGKEQLKIHNKFASLASQEQEDLEIEWQDIPTETQDPVKLTQESSQKKPKERRKESFPELFKKIYQQKSQKVVTQDDGIKVLVEDKDPNMDTRTNDTQEIQVKKERRPPFITLTEKSTFKTVRSALEIQDVPINIRRSVETREGIRLYPDTPNDFRAAIRVIDAHKAPRYTYTLPEEQTLKIVFRGIPTDFTEEEVLEDLRDEQNFDIISVKRMRKNKDTPYSMMLVQAPKNERSKELFQVRSIAGMAVRAEPKRKQTGSTQCYRCQNYGHVQNNCTLPFNCAFCAKAHPSSQCDQDNGPGKPAKCVLCKGQHPAFATSCPKHPQSRRAAQRDQGRVPNNNVQRPGVSYAAATQPLAPSFEDDLERRIANVLRALLPELIRTNIKQLYG